MADNDIYFNTNIGTRIIMKTSNKLKNAFVMEFVVRVFDNPLIYDIEGKRIVLCYTGSDQAKTSPSKSKKTKKTNIGIGIFAEKKLNENIKLTVMYCEGHTYWIDWFEQHNLTKITLDSSKWYHVVFNYKHVATNPGAELYVTDGPKSALPVAADYMFSEPMPVISRSSAQFGFGSTNEGLNDVVIPGICIDNDTLTTEVAQNVSMNFLRIWDDSLITNASTPFSVADLYSHACNKTIINMTRANTYYGQPPDKYPHTFIQNNNTCTLMFQTSSKGVCTQNGILNSAHCFQIGHAPFKLGDDEFGTGTIPNVSNNPSSTNYAPLDHFAISNTSVEFSTQSSVGGDPHIYPIFGEKFDLKTRHPYRLFAINYRGAIVVCNASNNAYGKRRRNWYINDLFIAVKYANDVYKLELNMQNKHDINIDNEVVQVRTLPNTYFNYLSNQDTYKHTHQIAIKCLPIKIHVACEQYRNGVNVSIPTSLTTHCSGYLTSRDKGFEIDNIAYIADIITS